MKLVSARKSRFSYALFRSRLSQNPNYLMALGWAEIIVFFVIFIVQTYHALSLGFIWGWDYFFAYYAKESFGVGPGAGSGYIFVYVFTGIALLISLAWSLHLVVTFIRYKLYKYPRFRRHPQNYNRELPSGKYHPVVLSRFLNEQRFPDDIFIALLHLAALDVVQITGSLDKSSPNYYLPSTKTGFFIHVRDIASTEAELEERLPSAIDRAAFKVLQSLADSDGVLTLEQLEQVIKRDFLKSKTPLDDFNRAASRELSWARLIQRGDIKKKNRSRSYLSKKWLYDGFIASIPWLFLLGVCVFFTHFRGGLTVILSGWPPITLLLLLWNLFEFDITDKGYRVLDECSACKRWMSDFTALRQAEAGATEAWDDYLTYAYVLEVNEPLVDDLQSVGGKVADDLCAQFVEAFGRPHFWWGKQTLSEYENRWKDSLKAQLQEPRQPRSR